MIAIAWQFTGGGIVFVAGGWSTRSRAESLAEAHAAVSRRFMPGAVGRWSERAVDASMYRLGGSLLMGVGALVIVGSLFG